MSFSLLLYGIFWGTLVLTLKNLLEYISENFQFWPFLCGEPLCYCFNLTDFLFEFYKIYFLCVYVCVFALTSLSVYHIHVVHMEARRWRLFLWNWTEVTDSCEVTGTGCWKQNLVFCKTHPEKPLQAQIVSIFLI